MDIFRKCCLILALFLTLLGNTVMVGFCVCDNDLFFNYTHECTCENNNANQLKKECFVCSHCNEKEISFEKDVSIHGENDFCGNIEVSLDDVLCSGMDLSIGYPKWVPISFESFRDIFENIPCRFVFEKKWLDKNVNPPDDLLIESFHPLLA